MTAIDTFKAIGDFFTTLAKNYGGTFLYCVIFAFIGWLLAKILCRILYKAMRRKEKGSEKTLRIASRLIRGTIYLIVILIILNAFKVPITAIVTLLSSVGIALSLTLKDTLSNFAEGFLLMISKPFQVGDFIEVNGTSGTVQSIEIIHTRLKTPDNKVIFIRNQELSGATITNYSAEPTRRLDLTFSIGYSDDIDKAKQVIADVLSAHPLAHKEPAPTIRVIAHNASSIDIGVRVWVNTGDDYWTLDFDLKEQVKEAFDKNQIEIPYPHMDVNILNPEKLLPVTAPAKSEQTKTAP